MICTVLPAPAVVGVIVTTGAVTLNVALAVFPAASVIVSVFVATAVTGMTNFVFAFSAPVASVAWLAAAAPITTAWPFTVAVSALVAANPLPVTTNFVPLLPVATVRAIDGTTVIAAWHDRNVFSSVRVNRYVPLNSLVGTTNHVVRVYASAPEFRTVTGPNVVAPMMLTPLNVAVEIAVKPVTVMVTLLPDAAVVGAVIVGAPITVTVVDAVSTGWLPKLPTVNCSV